MRHGTVSAGFGLAMCCAMAMGVSAAEPEKPAAPAADWATVMLLRFDSVPVEDAGRLKIKPRAAEIRLAEGKFGQALDCSAGGVISVSLPGDAQPTHEVTVECWLRLQDRGKERLQRVVGRSSMYGFYVRGRSTSLVWFVKTKPNTWKSVKADIPLKKWTHVAGTFDGRKMRLYVNGKLAAEADNPGETFTGKTPLYIGAEAGTKKYRFLGQIDEVRVSKIARTEFMTGEPAPRPKPTTRLVPVPGSALSFARRFVVSRAPAPPNMDGKLDDALWKAIPAAGLVAASDASTPRAKTLVRVAYDDRNLYVAFQCFEKGQETQRVGPAKRDDTAMFAADCVETFLQPAGSGSPYYQIAANTSGGLFDLRWLAPRKRENWNGSGIRAAGDMGFDVWTVELAVPFRDLGATAPQVGTEWRANFCRTEVPSRELTAWAYTGGGYHIPRRFGVLKFGTVPQAAEAAAGGHELRGTVIEEGGAPVQGVPVRTVVGLTRTDAFGDFRLAALPGGAVNVEIASPRYQRVVGKVSVQRPVEVIEPVVLKRVDPYRPAYQGPIGSGPAAWLKSSMVEPPDMSRKPEAKDLARGLSLAATPGEYESRAVAFFANRGIDRPAALITGLRGPAGGIPSTDIEVRWTQRLLKRVQYRRAREDAVFSWRFLWREPPERVLAGQVRHLVVTVRVPEKAAPGTYRGELVLSGGAGRVAALPVQLRVANFRLVTPGKKVGCYYRGGGVSDEQAGMELADIHDHGGSVVVWHAPMQYVKGEDGAITYDTSEIRRAVLLQKQHGIGPPYIVGTRPRRAAALAGIRVEMTPEFAQKVLASKEFRRIYAGAIRAVETLEKELGVGEFVYTWMDEVFGRGRFEAWKAFSQITRELTDHRIYITFHNRVQAMVDAADPYVDLRCYHGHTIDWWLGEGHTFEELRRELDAAGDEAWTYYNIRDIGVTSEWVRLCNGYWLWRSPLSAHTPWTYYSFGGSAFDDLDSGRHDFAYAAPHPTKPEMVSTLEWECCREGHDDLRYVATLQQAIAQAEKRVPQHQTVRQAKALVKSYWDADPRVPVQAETLTAEDYARRRTDIAAAIEALQKIGR